MNQHNYSAAYERLRKWRYLKRKKLNEEVSDDSSDEADKEVITSDDINSIDINPVRQSFSAEDLETRYVQS